MTRCILSANSTLRACATLSALFLFLATVACGESRVSTDTRTNWLSSCSGDETCEGDFSCLCGVCTRACSEGRTCEDVGASAVCVDAPGCQGVSVCAKEGFFEVSEQSTSSADSTVGSVNTRSGDELTVHDVSDAHDTSTTDAASDSAPTNRDETFDASVSGELDTPAGGADGGVCNDPKRTYESHDPAECQGLEIDCGIVAEGIGNVRFSDACGCGCEPFVLPPRTDGLSVGQCAQPSPPAGSSVNFVVLAESEFGDTTCSDVPSALLRSQSNVTEWAAASGCVDVASLIADVDFGTRAVIVAGTFERPSARVSYVEQTLDGVFHVGVTAAAYCGGARPSSGYVILTIGAAPSTPLRVVTETCFENCANDGGLPVP